VLPAAVAHRRVRCERRLQANSIMLPAILDDLEGVADPVALARMREHFSAHQHGFRVFIDDTCEPDWRASWRVPVGHAAAVQERWATKYGGAGFMTHLLSQSGFVTKSWRRANASVVPHFEVMAWPRPAGRSRLDCLTKLRAESAAWRRDAGARHFFLFTGERGPCCVEGRYKDVQFMRHHVVTQSGETGPVKPRYAAEGPASPPLSLLPCFDARKDVSVPTPNAHWPQLAVLGDRALPPEPTMPDASPRPILLFAAGGGAGYDCREALLRRYECRSDGAARCHNASETLAASAQANGGVLARRKMGLAEFRAAAQLARYCAICGGNAPWTPRLVEAMHLGCVPVLLDDRHAPPFASLLDYSTFAVPLRTRDVPRLHELLPTLDLGALQRGLVRARRAFDFHLDSASGRDMLPLLVFSLAEAAAQRRAAATAATTTATAVGEAAVGADAVRVVGTGTYRRDGASYMEHATIEVDSTRVVWLSDGGLRSGVAVAADLAAAAAPNGRSNGSSTASSAAPCRRVATPRGVPWPVRWPMQADKDGAPCAPTKSRSCPHHRRSRLALRWRQGRRLGVARGGGVLRPLLDGAADAARLRRRRARQPRQCDVPRLGEVLRHPGCQVPRRARAQPTSPAGRLRRRARPATAGAGEGPIELPGSNVADTTHSRPSFAWAFRYFRYFRSLLCA